MATKPVFIRVHPRITCPGHALRLFALALWCLALPALAAQTGPPASTPGVIKGELRDARGYTLSFEPDTKVVVLALPGDSPPFCEVVSAAWQDAFTEVLEGRDAHAKIGGLQSGVTAREGYKGDVTADGRFELRNLPLQRRLALAARVQGLWRPFMEEIWLTEQQPLAERVIDFYALGADVKKLRIVEHNLEIKATVNEGLRYLPITVTETIIIENDDPARAALPAESVRGAPFIEIELLSAPTLPDKALLAGLYGSELLFCQGTPAPKPRPAPLDDRANQPWMFGGGQMHGVRATYGAGPQIALDSWHPLNLDGALEFVGEGETFFRLKQDARDNNIATLVFNRPVPPAQGGRPGRLVLRVLHKCGVLYSEPNAAVNFARVASHDVLDLRVVATAGLNVLAVRDPDHMAVLGDGEVGQDGMVRYAPRASGVQVKAGERYAFSLRLDPQWQSIMADVAKRNAAPAAPKAKPVDKALNLKGIYAMLAVLFAIGFAVTLLYTFRATREAQRLRVNEVYAGKREIIEALAELERDYAARRIPASAYLEQRTRLLNRAVDLEMRRGKS